MNESQAKPTSRRFVIVCAAFVAGIIIVLAFFGLRELGYRGVLSRDISNWTQIDSAIRVYRTERGRYPTSLDESDFQPYISEHLEPFLREGRVAYHPPAPNSPPTFILVHMTTSRGDYSTKLDGTRLYQNSK